MRGWKLVFALSVTYTRPVRVRCGRAPISGDGESAPCPPGTRTAGATRGVVAAPGAPAPRLSQGDVAVGVAVPPLPASRARPAGAAAISAIWTTAAVATTAAAAVSSAAEPTATTRVIALRAELRLNGVRAQAKQ